MSTPLFTRFWPYAGAVSVRIKIMGIVLGLVLLLGAGVTMQMRAGLFRVLEARLAEQSVSVARDLAARSTDLILVNDLFALHQLLRETQENNHDLRYAFIVDDEGVILAHTFGEGFPADLLTANTVAPTEHHATAILQTEEGSIWDTKDRRTGTGVTRVCRLAILTMAVMQHKLMVVGPRLFSSLQASFFPHGEMVDHRALNECRTGSKHQPLSARSVQMKTFSIY